MEFEWDEDKGAANLSKHGVSFDEATTVFDDPLYLDFYDPDHSYKVGPERKSFGGPTVRLEPDVAEVFPGSRAVNEALRSLIKVTGENKPALPGTRRHA